MKPTELLEEMAKLLRLNDENPFKVRAFDRAVTSVAGIPESQLIEEARAGRLTEIDGVGKGIAEVLTQLLLEGRTPALDELRANLPQGLLELTEVPGLGPKKARLLIEELGIRSLGELEYACRENRLLKLTGFGEKLQQKILEGALFLRSNSGKLLLPEALLWEEKVRAALEKERARKSAGGLVRFEITGALRRRLEVVDRLEIVVQAKDGSQSKLDLARIEKHWEGCPLQTRWNIVRTEAEFWAAVVATTATEEHLQALSGSRITDASHARSEEDLYRQRKLPFIDPVLRETSEAIELARSGKLEQLVTESDIRGVFHLHTQRSDGLDSLEDMAKEASRRGYSFIGISDHSQSAFYAQGLKPAALQEQAQELQKARLKYPKMKIFWGIESDILQDGSLDYDSKTLGRFDFVIASIHSRFQMDRNSMTERILAAIRNPATRMLGHLTGRLLLGRPGYDIDTEAIIAECARRDVAIELNCHPSRLDIDWRWGGSLRRQGCKVSINPDAHELAGYEDIRWGVIAARKALLPSELVINTWDLDRVEAWLQRK